jgi:hypothetical protein
VFTVEWLVDSAWVLEGGDYYMRTDGAGGAIAAARRGHTKDGIVRRVVTYPGGVEVWTLETPAKRKQRTA